MTRCGTPHGNAVCLERNLTADGNHTYTFDAENRLIKVDGGNTATYVYDALGRRVEKIVSGAPTDYLYDPSGNVSNQLNTSCASVCIYLDYLYLGGQLAAEYENGLTYFVHGDHLGSTRLVTGLNQAIVQNLDYLPFGEHNSTDSAITSHEFTGDERDAETSLDHTQFRQYTSQLGRWLSPDLLLGSLDNPQSLNRYAYVLNDPTDLIDPLGLEPSNCKSVNPSGQCGPFNRNSDPGTCSTGFGGGLRACSGNPFAMWDVFDLVFGRACGEDGCHTYLRPDGIMLLRLLNSGNSSFFGGIYDKSVGFLAAHANYLPGVCTAGAFGYGIGGAGNDKGGGQGGVLIDKQIGKPPTVQPLGEVGYGPVGVGVTPSEALVFVSPVPKVDAGVVFAADWHNGFINNSGISIGLFAGKAGNKGGLAGGFGGGAYLTFSSAANCMKNF